MFGVGERVRAQVSLPAGHTRLPRYVRGRAGAIVAVRGAFPLPDDIVAGRHRPPRPLYSVRFCAADLWGSASGSHSVHLDLYEDYLTKVST